MTFRLWRCYLFPADMSIYTLIVKQESKKKKIFFSFKGGVGGCPQTKFVEFLFNVFIREYALFVVTSLSIQGHLIVVLLPEMLRSNLFASIPITSVSTSAIWLVIFSDL